MYYLNKEMKQAVLNMAGFAEWVDVTLKKDAKMLWPYAKKMRTVSTYLKNTAQELVKDLNRDQLRFLKNQSENCVMVLVTKDDMRAKKAYTVVETKTLTELANTAFGECFMCGKKPQEARNCPLKRTLLEIGAVASNDIKGVCPFKHGML